MHQQGPDRFRSLTRTGRLLLVVSAVVAGGAFFLFRSLDVDPPLRPLGSGRQPLYSLTIALVFGIVSFVIGAWFLKRRGVNIIHGRDEM
jgi:hypothetical protein